MSARRFEPSGPLRGGLAPPPDKSISHRAAILAAMADGESRIGRYLDAADTRSTLAALAALGASVEQLAPADRDGGIELRVDGIRLRGPAVTATRGAVPLDVGNAGTLMRILPGWLAGQPTGEWLLDGDESIRRRPVDRVAEPLSRMGGRLDCRDGHLPPLRVWGSGLRGISYRLPIASAQVKSCLLLAALLAEGETEVLEPAPSRDHTERMLAAAGAEVAAESLRPLPLRSGSGPARRVRIRPAERLAPLSHAIPGDFSSAAFFLVGALIVPGSEVRLERVNLNPTRVGLLGILNRMHAAIQVEEDAPGAGEPSGAVRARHGSLGATRVSGDEVPLAIDELPLVALAGCFADGETVVSGAAELRHKESDRVAAVVEGLRGVGADIEALPDGFIVRGTGALRGGVLDARGDHRLAMMGALAGLASRAGVDVRGIDAAAVSYPRFESDLRRLLGG